MTYQIKKQIRFDAGHRIPDHKSKCYHLHGHGWLVELAVSAPKLIASGSETGMVKDFGFLKLLLLERVHLCDHKMMLSIDDPLLNTFLTEQHRAAMRMQLEQSRHGYIETYSSAIDMNLALVICSFVPTSENLAEAFYRALATEVEKEVGRPPDYVTVWETPTSVATFSI